MKFCKYCNSIMQSEYETNSQGHHRYKEFHTCPNCEALCDEEVIEYKKGKRTLSEQWFNPTTKEFEK